MVKKWMQSAVKPSHKGIFKAKAERAGMSTHEYAEKEKNAGGTLGKEANLALTFEKHRPGKARVKIRKSHFKKES